MMTDYNTIGYKEKREEACNRRINNLLEMMPDFCSSYELYLRSTTVTKTRMEYLQDIYTFFRFLSDQNPLIKDIHTDITPEILEKLNGFDFDAYTNWLSDYSIDGSSKNVHNSNVTKKRKYAGLKSLFHFLYVRDFMSCNPIEKAKTPRVKTKKRSKIRVLQDDEYTLFLSTIDKALSDANDRALLPDASAKDKLRPHLIFRDKTIIYLFLGTGLRVSELCAIDCSNISFKMSYINVIRKGDADDKDTSDRVYFNDTVKDLLLSYIETSREVIGPNTDNYDALFLSSKHCRITPRAVEDMVKSYADASLGTGNGITPHKLRATFGTRYQREFGDISATQTVMNHADISVTAKYYLQEDAAARERVKDMSM